MPFCRNAPDLTRRRLAALVMALLLWSTLPPAWASAVIEPLSARLLASEDHYALSADFNIELGSYLEDIVIRGVPLYFQLEIEITRNRWFWPGEHIAGRVQTYRLSYIPLTRQYRLTSGSSLNHDYPRLADALRRMGRVAALPVVERARLKTDEPYQAALRLTLDRQKLPKPLQLDAIANKDWTVDARVRQWQFVPAALDREGR